jgi:hypothetical protein
VPGNRPAWFGPLEKDPPQSGHPASGLPVCHAAVSLWLNAGVPATEVARRAGHGVAVLLRVYANCIHGQATAAARTSWLRLTTCAGTLSCSAGETCLRSVAAEATLPTSLAATGPHGQTPHSLIAHDNS